MEPGELGRVEGITPLFLSGVYRSGTTLLTQITGAHPEVALTYDSIKFMRFCLDRYGPVREHWRRLVEETHERVSRRWQMEFDTRAVMARIEEEGEPTYATVYHALMSQVLLSRRPEARFWGEKIAVLWGRIPDFLSMFPQGRVIHIFRDPRDVAASFKHITYEPGFAYLDAAFNCLHAMITLREYQKKYGKEHIHLVRMEDLVERPEEEARRICRFLELEYSPLMLDPGRFQEKSGKEWQNNSGFFPDMQGISSNYRRWPEKLERAEVIFIEFITRDEMLRHGYEPAAWFPSREEWDQIHRFLEDPLIGRRYNQWLKDGRGAEGYPSDPTRPASDFLEKTSEAGEHID